MIARLIAWCINNRFLVVVLAVIMAGIGLWSTYTIPIDAIPDLSDVQVIIYTPWEGRDPQTVEDQVTYPLSSTMLAVPGVADVRAQSFFGFSFVYVIFEDGTDMYWARSRVLEYLNQVQGQLPEGVTPRLGPDASGLGWVYIYTLEDTGNNYDLGELRALQDWNVRYQLSSVEGVAEVATVGGAVRQYQVTVDPRRLLLYEIPLEDVVAAIKDSNNQVGGRVVEMTETEHMIRGRGYIQAIEDLEDVVLSASEDGTPILLKDVADVQMGPDMKRGLAEKNGNGEVVAGIVVMRYGENALDVINGVKEKIKQIEPGLPEGVVIRPAYDRSGLIERSVDTLKHTLVEELLITALVTLIFLWHARSTLVAVVVLPLGILGSFIAMRALGINANIMSLGGIAVAIGAMVDASVVLVENLHKHKEKTPEADHWELVKRAAQEVGPGLFHSLLVITVSFLPVFALQGQAGRLFKPLAYTKTFAMAASAVIAVTVIPILLGFFVRGKIHAESRNPVNRFFIWLYMPFVRFALRHKFTSMSIAFSLLALTVVPWSKIGSEDMPPLREGDILFMPTTVPGLSVTEARRTLQIQDELLAQFPEVRTVLGKIGRSTTPTDPAPLSMVETHIALRPEESWPQRLIEKGYLRQIGRDMLKDLQAAGLLTESGADLEPEKIAEQVEGMSRAEINDQTRRTLMQDLRADIERMRKGYEEHLRQQADREDEHESEQEGLLISWLSRLTGTSSEPPSQVEREDRWAAELLRWRMQQVRPKLPARIVEQTSRDLVDILQSQNGIAAEDADRAVAALREQWEDRIQPKDIPLVATTFQQLTREEMQRTIRIPGMPNWWLMPIETRIGMLTTGMKGDVGIKVYGTDLDKLAELGVRLEQFLKELPSTEDAVAERAMGGHYVDVEIDRRACARYGIRVGDVQRIIETAVGGMNIDSTVEGRYRFPINVRYPRELRDDPQKLERVLIRTSRGNQIPLTQVAEIKLVDGPPMIKSENGMLLVNIPVVPAQGLDIGTYVQRAQAAMERAIADGELQIPAGYFTEWSGKYQMMREVRERLRIIVPIALGVIFILIYFSMHNVTETLITMLTLPFALIGGVWGLYWLGYNWSGAVAVGFIALAGLAAETAIIMHVYLELSYNRFVQEKGRFLSPKELHTAVIDGAVLRVRPKLMTVFTTMLALTPILWSEATGAGPMKRIAVPVIGGMITSTVHTLVLIPVYYALYKRWEQWRRQRQSGLAGPPEDEPPGDGETTWYQTD